MRRNHAKEWRRWRRERGWTQTEMAEVLGLAVRTIVNIERGYTVPQMSSRMALAELKRRYREAAHERSRTCP